MITVGDTWLVSQGIFWSKACDYFQQKKKNHFLMFLISKALRCVCLLSGWRPGQRKEGVALSRRSLVTAWHFKKHEILLIAAGSTQTCTSTRVRTHYWLNGWVCNCTPWDRSCITVSCKANNKYSFQSERPVGFNTSNLKQKQVRFSLAHLTIGWQTELPEEKGESQSENTRSVNISWGSKDRQSESMCQPWYASWFPANKERKSIRAS